MTIKNTEENRIKLAEDISDACEFDDLLQYFYEGQLAFLEDLPDSDFENQWTNHYGEESND